MDVVRSLSLFGRQSTILISQLTLGGHLFLDERTFCDIGFVCIDYSTSTRETVHVSGVTRYREAFAFQKFTTAAQDLLVSHHLPSFLLLCVSNCNYLVTKVTLELC